MRAAAIAAAVVAAFVGVMYLRFASDSVPGPPPGAGGSQCVVFRNVPGGDDGSDTQATCGPATPIIGHGPFPAEVVNSTPSEPIVPDIFSGMKVLPLVPGPMLDLPPDLALIVETGCWQCDGGTNSLVRVSTRRAGSIVTDTLLDPATLGLPSRQFTDPTGAVSDYLPFITGYAIAQNGWDMIATICVRGTCAPEGLSSWSADSQTGLFRSLDGGITWTEIERLNVGASVFTLFPDGRALLTTYDSKDSTSVRAYPDLEELNFPVGLGYWAGSVIVLADGQFVLRNDHGVPIRSDGHPLVAIPPGESATVITDFIIDRDRLDGLALVSEIGTRYLVPFDSNGALGRGAFALGGESVVWSGNPDRFGVQLIDEGLILANASIPSTEPSPPGQGPIFDYRPVGIDLERGVMHLLRQFSGPEYRTGRNHIVAVQRGPFARVVNTDNTCVNVRAEPLPSAGILDCAAEGVLLRDTGAAGGPAGEWLKVVTPGGAEGWASSQYLER